MITVHEVKSSGKLKTFVVFLIILAIVMMSVYTIPAGTRGVLLTFGQPTMYAMQEGIHFKIPFAQTVKKMEVRTQKSEVTADSASKDLQDVQTTIALNYHIKPEAVPKLYQGIGEDYRSRVIDPAIQECIKAITANFVAEELITKRSDVKEQMKILIRIKLEKYFIEVDDFNIVNFQFSEEFDRAIESKVTAEQLKLKAERDLERIKIEKEQKITQAEAEAESLKLQRQVITPELVKLRQIEMMAKAIDKWNGIMPSATSGMPFIDVTPPSMSME